MDLRVDGTRLLVTIDDLQFHGEIAQHVEAFVELVTNEQGHVDGFFSGRFRFVGCGSFGCGICDHGSSLLWGWCWRWNRPGWRHVDRSGLLVCLWLIAVGSQRHDDHLPALVVETQRCHLIHEADGIEPVFEGFDEEASAQEGDHFRAFCFSV